MDNRISQHESGVQRIELRDYHPFVLDRAGCLWRVISGSAVVFASLFEDGLPVGERTRLMTALPGSVLLPVGASDSDIRAYLMAETPVVLEAIPISRVEQVAAEQQWDWPRALQDWMQQAAAATLLHAAPASSRPLPAGGELAIDETQCLLMQREKPTWIQCAQGDVRLFGEIALEADTRIPLFRGQWLQSGAGARLSLDKNGPQDAAGLWRSVNQWLHCLQALLRKHMQLAQAEEKSRQQQRQRTQSRREAGLQQKITGILDRQTTNLSMPEAPLLAACMAIGNCLGVSISPPARSENMDRLKDPVESITRASRLQYRHVLLRQDWWRYESGPLLAHRKDGHQPVALLPAKHGGYLLFDPVSERQQRVDAELSATLEPQATTFYRPLPESLRRPSQLIGFTLRHHRAEMLLIALLAALATIVGMLTPVATALVMDYAIPDANRHLLVELGLLLLVAAIGIGLFSFAQGVVMIRLKILSDVNVQSALWDRLLRLKTSFFKKYNTGDLLERVTAVGDINEALNGATLKLLLGGLMSILNLGLLFYYNSRLAWIALLMGAVVMLVTTGGGYLIHRYQRALIELQGPFYGLVVQMIHAVSKLRVAGAERRAFTLWAERYAEQVELSNRVRMLQDHLTVFNLAIPVVSSILLYWLGVQYLVAEQGGQGPVLTLGIFLAFNAALVLFISGITSLSNMLVVLLEVWVKGQRMQPILEAECEVDDQRQDPGRLRGAVSLANVDFRYHRDGPKILDSVSLHAEAGEFVALAGPSGSGKSTIFRLLLGFEAPEDGFIGYDGQDMAGLDISAVRRQIGVVLQSGHIQTGSIFDNIAGGSLISHDEAWAAAEDAALADDIRAMPMGMHTVVSEGGGNFSGGQRQRLFIARALATSPRILLMDEATSALDNRTQAIVSESLERRKVTRLVIAHRLSTIRQADRIYVMDQGRIVEQGNFAELSEMNGVFSSLVSRQTI